MTSPTMDAAVRYAGLGIAVFPLRPRMKAPYGRTTGLKMASADPALAIERWTGRAQLPLKPDVENRKAVTAGPSANVAIATGAPAGFWVLDLDGPAAADWLAAKEAQHGPLPDTVEQLTARGRHLCFAWDPAWTGDLELRNRSGLNGASVDVRGQDGYIVAPPSVHPGDEAKGVPPGWVYRWRPGHAPGEMAFAAAPQWLVDLARPAPVEAKPVAPRVRGSGQASPYGEAALDNACATIAAARVGSRDSTLYRTACKIGCLVGGGEIDEAYARAALTSAGRVHVPDAMSEAQLARQVDRALIWGEARPFTPGDRPRRAEGGERRPAMAGPVREVTGSASDAAGLWAEGRPADVGMVRTWLKLRRLPFAGDWARIALAGLRAHPNAPVNRNGDRLPALIAPLAKAPTEWASIEGPPALAVLPLAGGEGDRGADRFCWFIGDPADKAIQLVPCPADDRQLLVAIDLQDAWALGAAAFDSDDRMGVVVVPTLSAFCGAPKGDAYGRVNLDLPEADPASPPWTAPGMAAVYLAVRGDLRPPEVRVRKFGGGTARVDLTGEAAARFCGALAEQGWRRPAAEGGPGANAVRLLRPSVGIGFHSVTGQAA